MCPREIEQSVKAASYGSPICFLHSIIEFPSCLFISYSNAFSLFLILQKTCMDCQPNVLLERVVNVNLVKRVVGG